MIEDSLLRCEWHPIANVSELARDKPLAVELLGRRVVLWRSASGIHAWEDLCIHRGAKLSLGSVKDGCLSCPYHGWIYNSQGKCVRIPAHPDQVPPPRAKANVYRCQEAYDWIWVALEESTRKVPEFPEWTMPGYRKLVRGPYRLRAQGPRIVENFLDIAHFSIVHPGILGDAKRPEIGKYTVEVTEDGVEARDIDLWQPDGAGTGEGAMVQYTYHVSHPLTATLTKQAGEIRLVLMLSATPVSEDLSLAWLASAMQGADQLPEAALTSYIDTIFLQDVPVVESQRPECLPLDLQAELHLNSDRTSIAYRQWLRDRGLVYGTA